MSVYHQVNAPGIILAVFFLWANAYGLEASKLVWNSPISLWRVDNAGLSLERTNRRFPLSHQPGKANSLIGLAAGLPRHARNPDAFRLNFDILSGFPQYAAGLLFGDKTGFCKFQFVRDGELVMAEMTLLTNRQRALIKKNFPAAEFTFLSRNNELVWHRKTGRILLNGKLLLAGPPAGKIASQSVSLFGLNRAVIYRRFRAQITGKAISVGVMGMTDNTVTVLEEVFGISTTIRRASALGAITEEPGGRLNPLGP